MNIITLSHQAALRWPACREPFYPDSLPLCVPRHTTVFTFARKEEGIPSRINPWSLMQTQRCRSIFHNAGRASVMDIAGNVVSHRPPQELQGFPRRASLLVSEYEVRRRLSIIALKHIGDDSLVHHAPLRQQGLCRYRFLKHLWKSSSLSGQSLCSTLYVSASQEYI